jgi:ADP-ribosylglycohydrolase
MNKKRNALYGAIYGDIIGRKYEFPKMQSFPKVESIEAFPEEGGFTDDTLMTLASASYLLGDFNSIEEAYKFIGLKYEGDYYGQGFKDWLKTPRGTINNSYANGSLMRISPFMYFPDSELNSIKSCLCSHNNEESISSVVRLNHLYKGFGYRQISTSIVNENIFKKFEFFNIKALDTIKFIEEAYWYSNNTSETIKKVISFGGDTDTNASIIGELMNFTFNDLSEDICNYVESKLDEYLLDILKRFNNKVNANK